jgi:hypothetical protein
MHATQLVELAVFLATDAPAFTLADAPFSTTSLHQYWTASKHRHDIWARAFRSPRAENTDDDAVSDPAPQQPSLRGVVEEILLSEVLTRVWTATAALHDAHHDHDAVLPIARSIFLGHQEARRDALRAILDGQGLEPREVRRLNVLRQKCERWTDLLLAHAGYEDDQAGVAFDLQRVADFGDQLVHDACTGVSETAISLTKSSLRIALRRGVLPHAVNPALNRQIAGGILACLPGHVIDSTGEFQSLWQIRIEHTAVDTLELVDELLALD